MGIEYSRDGKFAFIDGIKFCRDDKTGYFLSSVNIGDRRKRLHAYIWEKQNGKIPEGMSIHHIDHNKMNNEIENLQCVSSDDHARIHAAEWNESRRSRQRELFMGIAAPAAVKWHKSDEGRKWHAEHARDIAKRRRPKKYICMQCGKEFESTAIQGAKFCSNNCKSAYRRASGVDNEIRRCAICGAEFTTNKYSKRKRCSKCRHVKP